MNITIYLMIKKISATGVLALLALFSCGKKTDAPINVSVSLSVSADSLVFTESGETKSLQVTTNGDNITATIPANISWARCQVNGNAIGVTTDALAAGSAERTVDITIAATKGTSSQQKVVRIKQKPWTLIWEDNFNTDGPVDATKWSLVSPGTSDWNKYMAPTNNMAFVSAGNLILKGIKDATGYHTAGVNTSGKFNFKYGKIEVRAKLSSGPGTWPAIWMMPQQSVYGGWPKSGEIDIMEHLNNDTKTYQVIHSNYVDNLGQKTNPLYSFTPNFNVGAFNTFGIEWYADKIDFFVNGIKTFSYPKRTDISADQLQWPFGQSFYIILNQALGGSWAGAVNDAILPVQTEVDYVKVYQMQ